MASEIRLAHSALYLEMQMSVIFTIKSFMGVGLCVRAYVCLLVLCPLLYPARAGRTRVLSL